MRLSIYYDTIFHWLEMQQTGIVDVQRQELGPKLWVPLGRNVYCFGCGNKWSYIVYLLLFHQI